MKFCLLFTFLITIPIAVSAQSGRVKPAETPAPNPNLRPSVIFIPAPEVSTKRPQSSPSPTPAPKTKDDEEVVKVESTLVPIPVSVVNEAGHVITNLGIKDFELKIDGKIVEISQVTRSETPIRLAMLFDNSSSILIARDFEKEAAVRFFRRVIRPEKDMAALFSVADYTRLEQPLTRDVSLLVGAIQQFAPPEGATALLDGIVEVADYLSIADGRRVIVVVSDGEDTYSDTTLEKVLKMLQLANCQVYVVKTKDFENYKRIGRRSGNANIRVLDAERRMLEIAGQTGGSVYSPIDEIEMNEAFRQISTELSDQYILSYYPDSETEKRGEFRAITVTVKDKPNFSVRTRKGYYVPKK